MVEHAVIALVALSAAGLTFFSGFGLGTLLLPAFAMFMPIETAIAATAVVHLANNLLKLALVARHADASVVWRFGVPALLAALAGAALLLVLGAAEPIAVYTLAGRRALITPVGLAVGVAVIAFAAFELHPRSARVECPPRWLPMGGVLSGFFGGFSGHQGALRSAFLLRAGLDAKAFVGTTTVCSVMVDAARLGVYFAGAAFFAKNFGALTRAELPLIVTACVAAFAGTVLGARLLHKTTLGAIRTIVGILLLATGAAMAAGWI